MTASALIAQATFEAEMGRFDEARALIGRAKELLEEVALTVWLAGPVAQFAGWVELLAGDPAGAERELRRGYDKLTEIGELSWLSTTTALLAEVVCAQGRDDEAEELTVASEESADPRTCTRTRCCAASGRGPRPARRHEASERLARESVALADRPIFPSLRWHTRIGHAGILRLAGEGDRAEAVLREAIEIAEEKGSLVAASRARDLLAPAGETSPVEGAEDRKSHA